MPHPLSLWERAGVRAPRDDAAVSPTPNSAWSDGSASPMPRDQPYLPPQAKRRARQLRREGPIPERILWGLLRDRQLAGMKFRRQHPVGRFIVDFCCEEARLVVELDGLTHVGTGAADGRRTAHLERHGYHVLRVTNDDLLGAADAVYDAIERAVRARVEELSREGTEPSP